MAKKIRSTPAKQEILNLFSTTKVALSHIDIQQLLTIDCDRVTIYRVLSRLVDEHKIHKIINTDGVIKYAACHSCTSPVSINAHNHVHFSCSTCKSVTCLENVIPVFQLPANYQIEELNFMISGICNNCSK